MAILKRKPQIVDSICQEAEEASQSGEMDQQPELEAPTLQPVEKRMPGWFSPEYNKSRAVTLNHQVLAGNRCVGYQEDSRELEHYKMLRTQIMQKIGGGGVTVMVTSALPGEGKTLTAINLAFACAKDFKHTVLLVDCDLRNQKVHQMLGYPGHKGLVDYLQDDCPFQELFVWPGIEKLTVISGGKTVTESSELIGSPGMLSLVQEMKNRYKERIVLIDAPPVLVNADAITLAPYVDYILVTVQAGQTSMQDVTKAIRLLPKEKLLGVVMNRQKVLKFGKHKKSR